MRFGLVFGAVLFAGAVLFSIQSKAATSREICRSSLETPYAELDVDYVVSHCRIGLKENERSNPMKVALATAYAKSGDCSAALVTMDKALKSKSPYAWRLNGFMHYNGICREKNGETAVESFKNAANYGDPVSMVYLAQFHLKGEIVRKSENSAAKYLDKARELGYQPAVRMLNDIVAERKRRVRQEQQEANGVKKYPEGQNAYTAFVEALSQLGVRQSKEYIFQICNRRSTEIDVGFVAQVSIDVLSSTWRSIGPWKIAPSTCSSIDESGSYVGGYFYASEKGWFGWNDIDLSAGGFDYEIKGAGGYVTGARKSFCVNIKSDNRVRNSQEIFLDCPPGDDFVKRNFSLEVLRISPAVLTVQIF